MPMSSGGLLEADANEMQDDKQSEFKLHFIPQNQNYHAMHHFEHIRKPLFTLIYDPKIKHASHLILTQIIILMH